MCDTLCSMSCKCKAKSAFSLDFCVQEPCTIMSAFTSPQKDMSVKDNLGYSPYSEETEKCTVSESYKNGKILSYPF